MIWISLLGAEVSHEPQAKILFVFIPYLKRIRWLNKLSKRKKFSLNFYGLYMTCISPSICNELKRKFKGVWHMYVDPLEDKRAHWIPWNDLLRTKCSRGPARLATDGTVQAQSFETVPHVWEFGLILSPSQKILQSLLSYGVIGATSGLSHFFQ